MLEFCGAQRVADSFALLCKNLLILVETGDWFRKMCDAPRGLLFVIILEFLMLFLNLQKCCLLF